MSEGAGAALAVVDASVSLKWVLDDEDGVVEALGLRDAWIGQGLVLAAPSLWLYEVLNGLTVAERTGRLPAGDGREALGQLLALGLPLADPPAATTWDQAAAWGITAYDASYVALAVELDTVVWTGDRRLARALAGRSERVRWIGDWRPSSGG